MQKTEEKSSRSAEGLYKFFIYFVLILLAVTIIVPVAWVFMASIKQNSEFCLMDAINTHATGTMIVTASRISTK